MRHSRRSRVRIPALQGRHTCGVYGMTARSGLGEAACASVDSYDILPAPARAQIAPASLSAVIHVH